MTHQDRAIAMLALAFAAFAPAARGAQPVVVELFTSQGCSSCPPANRTLGLLADRPDVLALSFGVTYWDRLGWKDTFASPQYTARQYDYAHGPLHTQVGTPEMVVDGRIDTVGQSPSQVVPLIRAARAWRADSPAITIAADRVTVAQGRAPGASAQVWLVRYDPRVVQVPVRRGENSGKTLPHRNVVRELIRLGDWTGAAASFPVPPVSDANLRTAILVQAGTGGPILAAARG
jgi:hypothetical protein